MTVAAKKQLDAMMAKFDPAVARTARSALVKLRKLAPGAQELVYDNYNALAIGFAASDRASTAIVSIALYPRWVTLFLLHGKGLPDPDKRLRGTGARVRHIKLASAKDIDVPGIKRLILLALARAKVGIDPKQKRQLLIKSISPKQRPRRS